MVRNAIFNIAYNGGSTLTAQAVELSVDDLLRGRRKDAIQVGLPYLFSYYFDFR